MLLGNTNVEESITSLLVLANGSRVPTRDKVSNEIFPDDRDSHKTCVNKTIHHWHAKKF